MANVRRRWTYPLTQRERMEVEHILDCIGREEFSEAFVLSTIDCGREARVFDILKSRAKRKAAAEHAKARRERQRIRRREANHE